MKAAQPPRASLIFVKAINIELTYRCDLACSHCFQANHRRSDPNWIDTDAAIQAITDAKDLGFTRLGLNLTGGEAFLPGSNVPKLLQHTHKLGIRTRVNTNCRWVGSTTGPFGGSLGIHEPVDVVRWLKDHGVAMMAFSLDRRYQQYPELWRKVITMIRACERQKLHYQMVVTGMSTKEALKVWRDLMLKNKVSPDHLVPVSQDMVDLGAAETATYEGEPTWCEGKGFFRPTILHIAPTGGVRSCMYAAGADWLGNIRHESLHDIAKKFADNRVVSRFRDDPKGESTAGSANRQHPCAVAVRRAMG